MIAFLPPNHLKAYENTYLIPQKDCPAEFMNRRMRPLVLIGATNYIHTQLQEFDIPFEGYGTPFEIEGHRMNHASDRYMLNGENINKQIAISNATYFLVTSLN